MKFIIITGGVISSIGKGVAAAVISSLLQGCGYSTRIKKFDPYLNMDPGTLNPAQHGEVYVTEDGAETDLDMGHYERIGKVTATSLDYTTMGLIMSQIIAKERGGGFNGCTVQVIPHVTDFIKNRFYAGATEDVIICEIGGTVGDIESLPFLEAASQLARKEDVAFIHISCLFQPSWINETKTKPTQHSISKLREHGIQPDILACRHETEVDEVVLDKLSTMCGIERSKVISFANAQDKCMYNLVAQYKDAGLIDALCDVLQLNNKYTDHGVNNFHNLQLSSKKIAIVTKYNTPDAHRSLEDALLHCFATIKIRSNLVFIDSEQLENNNPSALYDLQSCNGIIITGGFGIRGVNGKKQAIRYARENQMPFLGICLGMQLSVIDSLESIGVEAESTEFNPSAREPAICLVKSWSDEDGIVKIGIADMSGGTLRLGGQKCIITANTIASQAYKSLSVTRRHRHRYEVNPEYIDMIVKSGLIVSGRSKDGLVEIIEDPNHPWFVAVQYHPEFSSTPESPEELILSFVRKVECN